MEDGLLVLLRCPVEALRRARQHPPPVGEWAGLREKWEESSLLLVNTLFMRQVVNNLIDYLVTSHWLIDSAQ